MCQRDSTLKYVLISFNRCYGTRQSLTKWEKSRKIQSFETIDAAISRTKELSEKASCGLLKVKDHVGNHSSYVWDKTGLENEVRLGLSLQT